MRSEGPVQQICSRQAVCCSDHMPCQQPIPISSAAAHAQVNIEKPMGIRFARGNDGAAYVLKSDARIGNTDDRVEVSFVTGRDEPTIW
jgi:hypothetical protein